MRIPKGQALVRGVGPIEAHNVLPVVVASVDARLDAHLLALHDHVRDELPVGGLGG